MVTLVKRSDTVTVSLVKKAIKPLTVFGNTCDPFDATKLLRMNNPIHLHAYFLLTKKG